MRRSTYTSYKTTSGISLVKSLLLLFVFGTFVYVIYYAAINQDELSENAQEIQIIQPVDGAVKVRAENPGGMEIRNQNKRVFDLLEETASAHVEVSSHIMHVVPHHGTAAQCGMCSTSAFQVIPLVPRAKCHTSAR